MANDNRDVREHPAAATPERPAAGGAALLACYDRSLPAVYGYLLSRLGGKVALAEDLTAETFLAAVDAARRSDPPPISTPWLVGVARHKLVDHWRRQGREERNVAALGNALAPEVDGWDAELDALRAHATLDRLGPHHRAALTLRYLDDLPVAEVAEYLGRSLHATEALLVRARAAFRRTYGPHDADGGDDA